MEPVTPPPMPSPAPPAAPDASHRRSAVFRSPVGPALRRSPRYSPYRAGASYASTPEQPSRPSSAIRQVAFSPQLVSSTPSRPQLTSASSSRPPRSPSPRQQPRTSPAKLGRPIDDIWQHYGIEREGGKKHGRCKYCGSLKKNGKPSGNLLKHLTKAGQCPNVPRDVQASLLPPQPPRLVANDKRATQPPPTELNQETFEMALARIFFVCALPFILIEATIFREFFAMVAPTMKLPSRHKLSGVLLKRVRDELHHSHVIKLINQHKYVSLVTDGWTDTNSSSIMNFMVVAPGMSSVFWSSWSTRSKQHTAEYIAGEIDKVIAEIERDTTAKVIAVVTDNANNMRSAPGSIHSGHHVVSGGCSAHVLNLLMQGVCQFPAVKAVHLRAVAVTRFVRDHLALLDEFKVLQKGVRGEGVRARILSLPVPTRWYSVHNCMRCVLENSQLLEKLFLSPEYEQFRDRYRGTPARRQKLHYIMALVRDDRFWNNLRTVVRMLNPMIEALRNLEADNMYVSGVYKWFRWLRYHAMYGVTSSEQEVELENAHANRALGIELLSSTASRITVVVAGNVTGPDEDELHHTSPDDERLVEGGRYENVAVLLPISKSSFAKGLRNDGSMCTRTRWRLRSSLTQQLTLTTLSVPTTAMSTNKYVKWQRDAE